MDSWRKYLPDYEIIEWNEDNFPFDMYKYAKEAYDCHKYAYVTDVARLHILYYYGGIYMDTDVEVLKSLNPFLKFHGFSGFQSKTEIPTGIMASEPHNQWVKDQLAYYTTAHFRLDDVNKKQITNVELITQTSLKKHGLVLNNKRQELKYGMVLFPDYVFCAKAPGTDELFVNKHTYTIHHFVGSWLPDSSKRIRKIYQFIQKVFGKKIAKGMYNIYKKING